MKILCGTDLLPKSDSALERAGILADRLSAQLILVHAFTHAEPYSRLEEELKHAGQQLRLRATPPRWHHRIAPEFQVRTGSPVQVLVEAARDLEPELIVLGSHRRRFTPNALAGTIAERVVKQVDCPVLVVRRMPWRAYRRVLLIVDCADAKEVVAAAGRLMLDPTAVSAAASAHDSLCETAVLETEPEPAVAVANTSASGASELALIQESSITSDAAREIERSSPDLLILGAGRRGWFRRMFQVEAVNRVLAIRGSDVLLVPRSRDCMAPRRRRGDRPGRRWRALREGPSPGISHPQPFEPSQASSRLSVASCGDAG